MEWSHREDLNVCYLSSIVFGFKFPCSLSLNFSMLYRVSSCSCVAGVSEEIGASFFMLDASEKESIQVACMHYYYYYHHHHYHYYYWRQRSSTHQLYGVYQ